MNPIELIDNELKPMIQKQMDELKALRTELNERKNASTMCEQELTEYKEKMKGLEEKLSIFEQEKEREILQLKQNVDPLRKERDLLAKRMKGLENTIKVITQWVPSQSESIEVLLALASSPDEFQTFDEISEATKMASVVLKNRILPMLIEKGFVIMENNKVKMKNLDA